MGSPWPVTGPDRGGLLLVLGHLWTLGAPALLLTVACAVGRRVLARWPAAGEGSAESLLFGAAVGLGLLGLLFLGLGVVPGGYTAIPMLAAVVLPAAWARRELVSLPGSVRAAILEAGEGIDGRVEAVIAAVLATLVLAMLLLLSLPPATDWDTLMYHLPIPMGFLEAGRFVAPGDSLHVAFFGLIQFLYVPLVAFAGGPSVSVLSALLGALLLVAVWNEGRRRGGAWGGSGALAAVAGTTGFFLVAVTARVDTTLALYLLLGLLALLRAAEAGWDRGWATRAAVVLGLAVGIKHLALPFGVALIPLALWAVWGPAASTVKRAGAMAAVAVALGAPVLVKNQLLAGGPLYPYFTSRRVPPWLAELLGGPVHPEAIDPSIYTFLLVDARFNLRDLLLSPGRLSVEGEVEIFFLSPILLLAPLALLPGRRGGGRHTWAAAMLLVVPILYLAAVLGVSGQSNPRYLVPAIPSLAVAAGIGLAWLAGRLRDRGRRALVAGALALLGAWPLVSIAPDQLREGRSLAYASGRATPRETLLRQELRPLVEAMILAEQRVPETGRILLLGEARGAYFGREVIQDNILTNWPLLSLWTEPDRCLEGTGVTHVLMNLDTYRYYAGRGMDMGRLRLDEFETFRERCLTLVEERYGQRLFAARPTRAGTGG